MMKMDLNQIKEITEGAAWIEEADGYVRFHRFTARQEALYDDPQNPRTSVVSAKTKPLTSAGIKLRFQTNAKSFTLTARFSNGMNRSYYALDVYCDGVFLDSVSNCAQIPDFDRLACGGFSEERTKTFPLPEGDKEVCVYLPFSAVTEIKELCLDDGAYIRGAKREKILLSFGDSITHGYDAFHPANSYANRLADMLGYQLFNKGIGGEVFFPRLALEKDGFEPDLITVAYGTNDWRYFPQEKIAQNCGAFLRNIAKTYPKTKIAVISPTWRKDLQESMPGGNFLDLEKTIGAEAEKCENAYFISGFTLIPQEAELFADRRLHPNDGGFAHYAKNLYEKIKELGLL